MMSKASLSKEEEGKEGEGACRRRAKEGDLLLSGGRTPPSASQPKRVALGTFSSPGKPAQTASAAAAAASSRATMQLASAHTAATDIWSLQASRRLRGSPHVTVREHRQPQVYEQGLSSRERKRWVHGSTHR